MSVLRESWPGRADAYRGGMGMLGELFPGSKIKDEAGEDGDGQPWRLGPLDLERGVIEVHRAPEPNPSADQAGDQPADQGAPES